MPRYARTTTYVNGDVPDIDADDLNDLQDESTDVWDAISGRGFLMMDDFLGSAVDASKWATDNVTGTGVRTITGNNSTEFGFYQGIATAGDGTGQIGTRSLQCLMADFRLSCLLVISSLGGGNSTVTINIGNGANSATFRIINGTNSNKWTLLLGGVTHNTTVAPSSTGFQFLEIRRTSGLFEFLIDGTVVYSEAVALDIKDAGLSFSWNRVTSGNTTVLLDMMKFWCRR